MIGRFEALDPWRGSFLDTTIKQNMAAPKDERISVPIDDPNADTEWYIHFMLSSTFL